MLTWQERLILERLRTLLEDTNRLHNGAYEILGNTPVVENLSSVVYHISLTIDTLEAKANNAK